LVFSKLSAFNRLKIRKDESFLRIVKRLCEIAQIPTVETAKPGDGTFLADCSEATLYNYGYAAYLHLWRKLGIQGVLQESQHDTKISYPLSETVFLMAIQHLLEPKIVRNNGINSLFDSPVGTTRVGGYRVCSTNPAKGTNPHCFE